MKIVLASKSAHKQEALRAYCLERGWAHASIVPFAAASGGPEQPVGDVEGFQCALNRLSAAKRNLPDADAYVSIESFIRLVSIGDEPHVFDQAAVIVETPSQGYSVSTSQSFQLPSAAYHKAKDAGFAQHTVGEYVAKLFGKEGEPGTDPHAILLRNFDITLTRASTLVPAIRWAFAQLEGWGRP